MAFLGDDSANEVEYARAVGEYLKVHIQEVPPSLLPLSWYAEQARSYRDSPGFPNGAMHRGIHEEAARNGAVALLTGLGGDQVLEGSRAYYAEELAHRHWATLWSVLEDDAKRFGSRQTMASVLRFGIVPLLPDAIQAALRFVSRRMRGKGARDASWLSTEMQQTLKARRMLPRPEHRQVRCSGQRSLLENLYYAFNALGTELTDRYTSSAGIEVRHPFRVAQFVQYAFSTPERLRMRAGQQKYIHRQAMQGVLPDAIATRVTKADFSYVFARSLVGMRAVLTERLPRERSGWLNQDGMALLFRSYQSSPQDSRYNWALWNVFVCDKALA